VIEATGSQAVVGQGYRWPNYRWWSRLQAVEATGGQTTGGGQGYRRLRLQAAEATGSQAVVS